MFRDITRIKRALCIGAALSFLMGCAEMTSSMATSEKETNKALAVRFIEGVGTPDFAPTRDAILAEDNTRSRHEFENLLYNAEGDTAITEAMQSGHDAITNRINTVTRLVGEGNQVAMTYRIQGDHTGNFYGIPATGKKIDIEAGAIFTFEDGKLVDAWFMADEANLLRDIDALVPVRQDGKLNLAPHYDDVRTYDEALAEHLANPEDTAEWRHTKLLLSYKSQPENRPEDYTYTGRPYINYLRSGIVNAVERGAELGVEGSHGASISGRRDMISTVLSDGDQAMMSFRLTALNSGPLYGVPASGNRIQDWELGFGRFQGDHWVDAWWMADELGFLLINGTPEALEFLTKK